MEVDHLRNTVQVCAIKEEKRDEVSNHDEEDSKEEDEKLELAKAKMGVVREENQRLRLDLDQIMKDYQILQEKFQDIMKNRAVTNTINHQEMVEPDQLVSLSLGRTLSSELKKDIDQRCKTPTKSTTHEDDNLKNVLALGLDHKFDVSTTTQAESSVNLSPENTLEEAKEEAGDQTWPPQKNLKTKRSGDDNHEVAPQNPAKKTRVSVRIRCDTPTINDGCQWRKYGQKIAKGNPCPRAYYRCTVSPSCPVRKQVQRCAQDMSILITTYEGTHNHPLPMSATAMASTTSAAASMLTSGSSTSAENPNSAATGTELHGMNFYLSENSKLKPFYPPHSSVSPSPLCPTITLDLTSNTVSSSSPFNRSLIPTNFPLRFSTTNLNFNSLESSALPISWSNGVLGYNGAQAQPYDHNNQIGSRNFGIRQPQENLYQSYMQKNMANATTTTPIIQQSLQPDTFEAATKAITSDPNFQSALQAALTSIICGGDKIGQNMNKLSDLFPVLSSLPSTSNANKYPTSFTNSQQGSLMSLPQTSLPFSTSKGKSSSPENNRDHVIR